MDKRLLIVSDLWGDCEKSKWFDVYASALEQSFEVLSYDSCGLGGIDTTVWDEAYIHKQFVNGGIDRAVSALCELELEPIDVLAFSVGGVIAWKYGIASNAVRSLTCVSSTRLRKETKKPQGRIDLFFGADDTYRPSREWCEHMGLDYTIVSDRGHLVYRDAQFAQSLCQRLKDYA